MKPIKSILKKSEDPYLGLLAYQTTALQNGYSLSTAHGTKTKINSTTTSNPFLSKNYYTNKTQRDGQEIKAVPKEEL